MGPDPALEAVLLAAQRRQTRAAKATPTSPSPPETSSVTGAPHGEWPFGCPCRGKNNETPKA